MNHIPLTEGDLEEIDEHYIEHLTDFSILEKLIDPDTPEGRRVYQWLEEQGIYSDIDFLCNWARLRKAAKEAWAVQSN